MRLVRMTEVENNFLEHLEYQISMIEKHEETYKKIPVFTEQLKQVDKSVMDLKDKFDRIQLRDKYQIIITELEELIEQAKK
jgi:hypothetical protein